MAKRSESQTQTPEVQVRFPWQLSHFLIEAYSLRDSGDRTKKSQGPKKKTVATFIDLQRMKVEKNLGLSGDIPKNAKSIRGKEFFSS